MTIRPVAASEVDSVVALVTDTLAEFGIVFGIGSATDADLAHLPASYVDRGGAFWVAVDEADEIVGTVGLARTGPDQLELRKMYLRLDQRGRGLGKALLQVALAWAEAQPTIARITLDTTEQMLAAIALYESHGFVRDDRHVTAARCSRGYVKELRR